MKMKYKKKTYAKISRRKTIFCYLQNISENKVFLNFFSSHLCAYKYLYYTK